MHYDKRLITMPGVIVKDNMVNDRKGCVMSKGVEGR